MGAARSRDTFRREKRESSLASLEKKRRLEWGKGETEKEPLKGDDARGQKIGKSGGQKKVCPSATLKGGGKEGNRTDEESKPTQGKRALVRKKDASKKN